MNEEDKTARRGWCIDYALRLPRGKQAKVTAGKIISDAKKFEEFMFGTQQAEVLKLAKSDKKTGDA